MHDYRAKCTTIMQNARLDCFFTLTGHELGMVSLVSEQISTRAHARKSIHELVNEIPPEACKIFAQSITWSVPRTCATAEKALIASYSPSYRWSQTMRRNVADLLEKRPETLQAFQEIREEEFKKKLMGSAERRAILSALVRTPLTALATPEGGLRADLTPDQALALKKVKVRIDDKGTTREVEAHDRVAAARLDAELAGDLARGSAQVNIQSDTVNLGLFVLPRAARQVTPWDECLD
jgi:hypothetical protein